MLNTDTWRGVAPRMVGPARWWSRHGAALLPPALGMLALLCGALWAIGTYSHHQTELRLAETSRFLEQFRAGPVAEALARVRAAWQAEGGRQGALLARLEAAAGDERTRLRRDHQRFVLETIEDYRLQPDIEIVRRFVARLATCVRAGSCDGNVLTAQLGPALWLFRNRHLPYFQFEYVGPSLDPDLAAMAPRTAPEASSPDR